MPTRLALPLLCLLACVAGAATPAWSAPPSFRRDVMPVLSKAGCNLGTCHGNQYGKGGFRLSLRGQDPATDFTTLTRSHASRRINPLNPAESLLLRKPLALVPHEGGRRLHTNSTEYRILHDWIAAGMPADPENAPTLVALQVEPAEVTLYNNQRTARIEAIARFSDGTSRPINELAVFESSSPDVIVSPAGDV